MDEPKQPWWRKKRWWAAGLIWLVVAYAVGYGPLVYAVSRQWLTSPVAAALFIPAELVSRGTGYEDAMRSYARWWMVKALQDEGGTVRVLPDETIVTTRILTDRELDALDQ